MSLILARFALLQSKAYLNYCTGSPAEAEMNVRSLPSYKYSGGRASDDGWRFEISCESVRLVCLPCSKQISDYTSKVLLNILQLTLGSAERLHPDLVHPGFLTLKPLFKFE